ncbi:ankyrin repeat domain-containing protein [Brachyspira pilosicoli]|uniref:ankyrin repeat domain-containing protein n=1 Tax=Brachyspira pilosicoli TaxID=52584 RepID=UPI001CA52B74|nr:ankyrin repeat domain-containing protein [Brachyspira pilosicoli]MBW5400611.1 ankyrin repeat domain-containing protein [Brachyspira pilosicoli]
MVCLIKRSLIIVLAIFYVFSLNIYAINQKESELFLAIKEKKNERDLREILKYRVDFSATNEMGLTPLLYAIECNNERALRVLLEYSDVNIEYKLSDDFAAYPDINKYEGDSVNIGGATPLMFAIFKNNSRIVKQLIDKGANVKARDNEGNSAFLYACGFGDGNIIRMLLQKDKTLVNDKTPNGNLNGLHYAAAFNNLNTINFLIKNVDMNINDRDSNGCTALYYAAYYAKNDAYNLLIKLGANKDIGDNYGVTPEYILSGGSSAIDLDDNNKEDNNTNTYNENMFIARVIQTSDTNALRDIMMYSNFNMNSIIMSYETPLTYAIHLDKYDMVNELLKYRVNNTNIINIETSYIPADEVYFDESRAEFTGNVYLGDVSPLQYAIFKNNTNIINTLLYYGADINRKDSLGDNALMYAARFSSAEVIDTILNYSSNSYRVVDIYGNTPLHNASSLGNTNALIALMNRTPININIQNVDGDTPLHLAVKNNNSNTYRFLLLKGADYTIKNYDGKTASDLLYGDSIENIMGNFGETNIYDTNSYNNNNNNLNVIQANNIVEDFLYDNMPDDDTSYYKKEEENNEYAHQLESKILFDAIYKDDAALIHNAISNTVDLNTRNPEGFTPLLYAIHYDKTNALNILLSYTNKIDINKTLDNYTNYYSKKGINFSGELVFDKTTPLEYAIFKGNINIVSMLMDNNADIYLEDSKGYNGIFYASAFGDYALINKILQKYPPIYNFKNSNGDSVLHIAASYGNNNAISFYLYNTFLSINTKNNEGKTPLDLANEKGYTNTVDYLIKGGAKYGNQ